jgi:hypothetical protein
LEAALDATLAAFGFSPAFSVFLIMVARNWGEQWPSLKSTSMGCKPY